MVPKSSLLAFLCALTFTGCDAGLDAEPLPESLAHSASAERLDAVRLVESVEGDDCEVVPRRSTSDASGRREGFTMATVRCAWPAPKPREKRAARTPSEADAEAATRH